MDETSKRGPSLEDLEKFRREHARELRRLEKMTDEQFEAFKRNFELGRMDPGISRREAIEILRSMICTNLSLQQEQRAHGPVEKSDGQCYPEKDPERE